MKLKRIVLNPFIPFADALQLLQSFNGIIFFGKINWIVTKKTPALCSILLSIGNIEAIFKRKLRKFLNCRLS